MGVSLNSQARRFETSAKRSRSAAMIADACCDQQGLRGVDDVVRSQAVVEPAGVRADDLRHRRGEGDDIVADLGLDLVQCAPD